MNIRSAAAAAVAVREVPAAPVATSEREKRED